MNPQDVKAAVNERKKEAADFEARSQEAMRLDDELKSLRKDLERHKKRQDAMKALGNERLEIVQKAPYPGLGVIEWEPVRSRYTGRELAKSLQADLDYLESEISSREQRIAELLA